MKIIDTWKNERAYVNKVKYVPIEWLLQFKGNQLRRTEEQMFELYQDIKTNGLKDPLWMAVGKENRKIILGEGNHRLELFRRFGLDEVPLIIGLQNNAYQGLGLPPYDYPYLKDLTYVERGLVHPDVVFTKYKILGGGL